MRVSRMYAARRPSCSAALRAFDVVDDAHTVTEALGAAPLHRLPDARQPERLAGVDRGVEVLAHHVLEGVEVARRRVAGLGAGDVEADDAGVAEAHRQLGDLQAARRRAHRRGDGVDRQLRPGRPAGEAVEDRLHHLVEGQPLLGAQLRRHAHLGVDHAVGGEVLGALVGDPLDGVTVLHHADRVGERLEVEDEVVALGAAVEPGGSSSTSVVGRSA